MDQSLSIALSEKKSEIKKFEDRLDQLRRSL